jgi:3-oxoadipate enol-lactonase
MPTLAANGIDLYYELHGPENGDVLVLNNGILMTAANSWGFQTPVLARRYRVLLYDCRGQGQSEHPDAPYTMAQHADDLAALLDGLAIERAHVAGISYGGEVAQAFALRHAGRVRSLILADTVSEVGPELWYTVEGWLASARAGDPEAFFAVTVPSNFSAEYIATHEPVLAGARVRYRTLDFPAVVRLCEAFLAVNFTSRLGEIKVPACIVVGEQDRLKGLPYAQILHRGIQGSELHVLPGAGHASCWEAAAEFNTVVLGFLAKQ